MSQLLREQKAQRSTTWTSWINWLWRASKTRSWTKCPTAKRACDLAWVTAKNLEEGSSMSTTTLWRWLGRLEKARRISTFSDMKKWSISHAQGGSTPTTFYNLNVLNQLAMACIDNEKLNEVSCQFSDMLFEKMTEGMSGTQPQPQIFRSKHLLFVFARLYWAPLGFSKKVEADGLDILPASMVIQKWVLDDK